MACFGSCPQQLHLVHWIAWSVLTAIGSATTSLTVKGAVAHRGALRSSVVFRPVAGLLLFAIVVATGTLHRPTPGYWRAVAMVLPPEAAGMAFMSLALRRGDLSRVQPIFGLLPVFVMLWGMLFLHEVPSAVAGAGIALVTLGVYCVGLQPGFKPLEPLLSLGRDPSSRYALMSTVCWSLTTVLHKFGIAEVGPLMWGATLSLGSGAVLALALPFVQPVPTTGAAAARSWMLLCVAAAVCFAVQQIGLQMALLTAQAGYVMAVSAISTLMGAALGVFALGERGGRTRLLGALLVTCGAALVALRG